LVNIRNVIRVLYLVNIPWYFYGLNNIFNFLINYLFKIILINKIKLN
jgi:hypothetical protein